MVIIIIIMILQMTALKIRGAKELPKIICLVRGRNKDLNTVGVNPSLCI